MNNTSESAVICRDIQKTFGKGTSQVNALRGVNLTISKGELRMLMGPSGSGKTTLVSIIAGILSQTSGECLVSNINLNELPDQKRTFYRGHHIGFVFQVFNLIPTLTNEENISVPLLLNNVPRKEAIERSKVLLKEFGLEDKIGSFPTQLSGGQQQRIAIARAMIHNPDLIVCDEPTSFLDHETGMKIMDLLKNLVREKKVTVIVVTHDPRIVPFADHIDRLEDGMIVEHIENHS